MLTRILLPLDGSGDWESLVPHLLQLANRRETEILALEAVPFMSTLFEMSRAWGQSEHAGGGDMDYAERTVAGVAAELRSLGFKTRELVQIGAPIETISRVARRQNATLIALAVRERAGFPVSLFESLAEQLLHTSPVPIYAVPVVTTGKQASTDVVIPVDGSEDSLQSIPAAAKFCRRLHGRLVFVHVRSPGAPEPEAREVLDAARRRSQGEGLPTEGILRDGDPATEILGVSQERRAALIAMRTRLSLHETRGPLGSVTVRVLRAARFPTLIVRKGAA